MINSDHEMEDLSLVRRSRGIERESAMRTGLNERYEKPWQRVPSPVLLVTVGFYLLFGYLAQLIEDDMPQVILNSEIPNDVANQFSEQTALQYLNELLGDEARVSGTKYHLKKTGDLKQLIDSVAEDAKIPVRTDWQLVSGDYWLQFGTPHVNRYVNVSNIIAVLEGESGFNSNGTIGTSLLVNCHYDSVPYAIGASDNGVFCAVMIEVLSRLSRRNTKLRHNVIFLFNGAEENPLMGSHAFLHHEWSKNCFGVINLDASGMNGKPTLFQVTDPRLLNIYASVVSRPNLQGVGEFLFSSGAVPSDTDFRIFRDFGQIYGVDIAFVKWGVVYHTPYDNPSLLMEGVVQNAGSMLLNFVLGAAQQNNVKKISPTSAVYFDYLNWFTITYSLSTAVIVDVVSSLVGFAAVAFFLSIVGWTKTSIKELLWTCLGRIICTVSGILFNVVFTAVMVATTIQLRYLSRPWLVVGIWWVPFVVGAVATSHLYDKWRCTKTTLPRSIRVYQAHSATILIMSLILFITAFIPDLVSVRYVLSTVIVLTSVTSLISMTVYKFVKLQGWQHLLLDSTLSLISVLFICAVSLRLNATMLPILGRTNTNTPDYIAGLVQTLLVLLFTVPLSGLELLFSRKHLIYVLSILIIISTVLIFVPMFPYQGDGPATQRHYWFHSEIITHDINGAETNRTSGLLVTKHDAYTLDYVLPSLREKNIEYKYKIGFAEDCVNNVHCNLPLYRARFDNALKDSLFIYTGPPASFNPQPSITLMEKQCSDDTCVMSFRMIGPAHNLITLSPRAGVNITSWSYSSPVKPAFQHKYLPVYLITHSEATYSEVFNPEDFTLHLKVPTELQSSPIIDIAHHAHKIYHKEDFTAEYIKILEAMPKYFSVASNLSIRTNYVF